ncbi:MAG: DNA-binding response regulator [Sphingomonas bacterium]|nr:DNA-binding response regulator [Sphingomonas bacterium]
MCSAALGMAVNVADTAIIAETAATLQEAEDIARRGPLALILLDLLLPDVEGFAGLALIRAIRPDTPIAIVSSLDHDDTIRKAIGLGARGFISKASSIDQMVAALRVLLAGGQWFPDRALANADAGPDISTRIGELSIAQLRVLRAIADGGQNKHIAHALNLSEPTIKSHLNAIFRKLGVSNRTQAVLALRELEPIGR